MVLAYIRLYLRLGLGNLSILELNDLQKEIDGMIRARCDMLLEQQQFPTSESEDFMLERRRAEAQ